MIQNVSFALYCSKSLLFMCINNLYLEVYSIVWCPRDSFRSFCLHDILSLLHCLIDYWCLGQYNGGGMNPQEYPKEQFSVRFMWSIGKTE